MSLAMNVEQLGNEWVHIVRSCCPNVADTSWKLQRGDVVITTCFAAPPAKSEEKRPQTVEVIVGAELVEAYLGASMMQRFYATGRLIECVLAERSGASSRPAGDAPAVKRAQPRSLTYSDLGMELEPGY